MPRMPKPWFRKDRQVWFVQVGGKQHLLGSERKAAFERYHELMASHGRKKPQAAIGQCVVALMDAFLEWTKNHRAEKTFEWYQDRLQSFAETLPAGITVDQLRPHHVQQWTDSHTTWSGGMKRGAIIAVQRVFNWAVKLGHVERNPVANLEKPRAGRRESLLAAEEYRRLLAIVGDQEFRDLLTVAWETGARPQELLRVEARHVDAANGRWVFPQSEAKGKRRVRVVYLTDTALAITRRLVLKYPEGRLFRNTDGMAWHPCAVNCRFHRLKPKVGRKLCLYIFRHSFATRLLETGVDALTVATLLGHADVSTLGRVYQHLAQNPKNLLDQLKRASA